MYNILIGGYYIMPVDSKHNRYRAPGEETNVHNAEQFGEPEKTLFTSKKVFSLRHHIDITDENENVVYTSESEVLSLHDKTDITAADGRHIAHIEKKLISLHERHFVTMESGIEFTISSEIFHVIKDIINIEGLGWQLRGNIIGLNFELYDENEEIVATISQKLISLHDKYSIDIYQPAEEEIAIAILITLQHMITEREASSASSSASSTSTTSAPAN